MLCAKSARSHSAAGCDDLRRSMSCVKLPPRRRRASQRLTSSLIGHSLRTHQQAPTSSIVIRRGNKSVALFKAILCRIAALMIVFQAFSVAFATGAVANNLATGAYGGAICGAGEAVDQDSGSKAPQTPHCGACCILHSSSAIENELAGTPVKAALDDAPKPLVVPTFHADAIHSAPELRPLCSRAPPAARSV